MYIFLYYYIYKIDLKMLLTFCFEIERIVTIYVDMFRNMAENFKLEFQFTTYLYDGL